MNWKDIGCIALGVLVIALLITVPIVVSVYGEPLETYKVYPHSAFANFGNIPDSNKRDYPKVYYDTSPYEYYYTDSRYAINSILS
jgi:hypothetical protein